MPWSLQWRYNGRDNDSNHQPHDCLPNRLFRRRSKKTSKLRVTGLCAGNSPGTGESPHKWPVTRKRFPFDDVIRINTHESIMNCKYDQPKQHLMHIPQPCGALMFLLLLAWKICWACHRVASDLRCTNALVTMLWCFTHVLRVASLM